MLFLLNIHLLILIDKYCFKTIFDIELLSWVDWVIFGQTRAWGDGRFTADQTVNSPIKHSIDIVIRIIQATTSTCFKLFTFLSSQNASSDWSPSQPWFPIGGNSISKACSNVRLIVPWDVLHVWRGDSSLLESNPSTW